VEDVLKPILEIIIRKLTEYLNNNDYWTPVIYAMIFVVLILVLGYLINWYRTDSRYRQEFAGAEIKQRTDKIQYIEKIQGIRRKYEEQSILFQASIMTIIEAMQSTDTQRVAVEWCNSNDIFFNQFMPSFVNYIEVMEIDTCKSRSKRKSLIDNEIIKLFQIINTYLRTVNMPFILGKINKPPIEVSKASIIYIVDYVDNNTNIILDYTRKKKINELLKEMQLIEISLWGLNRTYK